MKIIMVSTLALLIVGCAGAYKVPQGETARLRIVAPKTKNFASMRIMNYPGASCESPQSMGMIGGIARLKKNETLGMPLDNDLDQKQFIERRIGAGNEVMFSLRGFYSGGTCTITAKFIPKVNSDYQLEYIWDGGEKCYSSIKEIAIENGTVSFKPVKSVEQVLPSCGKGFT